MAAKHVKVRHTTAKGQSCHNYKRVHPFTTTKGAFYHHNNKSILLLQEEDLVFTSGASCLQKRSILSPQQQEHIVTTRGASCFHNKKCILSSQEANILSPQQEVHPATTTKRASCLKDKRNTLFLQQQEPPIAATRGSFFHNKRIIPSSQKESRVTTTRAASCHQNKRQGGIQGVAGIAWDTVRFLSISDTISIWVWPNFRWHGQICRLWHGQICMLDPPLKWASYCHNKRTILSLQQEEYLVFTTRGESCLHNKRCIMSSQQKAHYYHNSCNLSSQQEL